jgi:ABC-2 type transport system permease protein
VIIPILMFFPAFVAGSMVVDSISEELENHTLDTLWSAPLSLNVIFGAKIVAALVLAVVQCALWSTLLRLNRIPIHNLGLVLLLAALLAATIAVGSAFVAVCFKDRERSQFVYSLFILLSAGMGYFFDASPITVMTRLAAGDYYTGVADVAIYGVLLLAPLAVFFSTAKRLIAMPS